MKTMTPDIYEAKRNNLIALLDNILDTATGLSQTARAELTATTEKLKRNSFEIVFVGEFQGGKSTIFDTICDGREISPRGIGIKTSACKISAQSIPADQSEHADLRWKTDEELMLTMLDIVRDNLINDKDDLALFKKQDETGNTILPSLSDPKIRELAAKALHLEWERYLAKPSAYDPDQAGRLDLLQISSLILKFYGTKELENLRAKTSVTIDDLKPLVVFPKDWLIRWQAGGEQTEWAFSEIPFVFLGNVACHIHCANLERLGCVITDCPGLFAGPWDTAVAQRAMMQADAILYLIGGQRAITEADLRALSHIRKTQQSHKVFFAINARCSNQNIVDNLRPVDFAAIKQRGFDLESPAAIDVFNALLAFDAKTSPADPKAWGKEVSSALALYLGLDLTDDDDQAKAKQLRDDLGALYQASDFASLLAKIETSIVTKKFESVLVKGGTDKATTALDALNGDLKQKEEAAAKDLAEVEKEAAEARAKLEEFQSFVTDTVAGELDDPHAASQTAKDYVRAVYLDNIDDMADLISTVVVDQFENSDTMRNLGWALLKSKCHLGSAVDNPEDTAKEALREPIADALNSIVEPATEGWISNLREGQNDMFNLAYGRALDRVAMQVRDKWDSSYKTDSGFLSGLAPNLDWDISKAPALPLDPVTAGVDVEQEAFRVLRAKVISIVLAILCTIVAAIVVEILLAVFASIIVTGGIIPIVALIASGVGFAKWFSDRASAKFEQRLRPAIAEKLRDVFSREQEGIVQAFKQTILAGLVGELKNRCRESLGDQLAAFNRRVEETFALKRQSLDEQKRIAKLAKKVRTEQIEPARAEIAAFGEDLAPYFK